MEPERRDLPEGWTQRRTPDGVVFYEGPHGESSWRHPVEDVPGRVLALEREVAQLKVLVQRRPRVIRCKEDRLKNFNDLQLNLQDTHHIIQEALQDVPQGTVALVVAVISSPQNHPGGHLYYAFHVHQEGAGEGAKSFFQEQRFDGHGNVYRSEIVVPWDSQKSNVLVVDFNYGVCDGSYPSHGNINKLSIKLTGFWTYQ
eukprot:TRINITY_DN7643_c0_g1_i1.p1 TRINITY_DN7643_c0_g1~~TRINITY_DN7643_c0_g1_i1.p1  ORF type:complete len:200 (-),score=35.24 TRINITY_DN7643_c0_g1_i1:112-711(-)